MSSILKVISSTYHLKNKKPYSFVPKRQRRLVITNHFNSHFQPKKVAILMGSPNDYEKMKPALDTLTEIGLEPDMRVLSAHRQPYEVTQMATNARNDGYAAVICGAGMSAHLAGVVAANTTLPVVGVPLSSSSLNGLDSLYSTVQMPKGIPVATVAIDNAENAAILVVQMLSITNTNLSDKLRTKRQHVREVLNSNPIKK